MNVLLDTHVWFWSVVEPSRLSSPVREIVEDGRSRLHISAVTWWELHLLFERGRLDADGDPAAWFAYAQREFPVIEEPITAQIAIDSRRMPLSHADPADRFIAATARCRDLVLATHDRKLLASEHVPTLNV